MSKIKILHVIVGFIGGGVEEFLYNNIINMPREDYDISIIAYNKSLESCIEKFKKLDIKIYELNNPNVKDRKNNLAIYKIIKENKFDIVHVHMTEFSMYPCLIAKNLNVKVIIAHSHNVYVSNGIAEKIKFMLHKSLTNAFANRYMACSKDAAISLFGNSKVKNNKVTLINNGINLERFLFNKDTREEIREELKIKSDEILIGNIGRFVEQKNHKFILDIFKEICKKSNQYKLLLIGEGKLKDEMKKYALELDINNKVIFKDNTSEIEKMYSAMDYFLFPSLFEGLGIVTIEAQTNGLQVLASDVVPREAQVTNNIKFFSLSASATEWANIILNTEIKDRAENIDIKLLAKFDNKKTAIELDKYYKAEV